MFTTNFRRLMQEKGFTQEELAKKLKVSQQVVSQWFTGKNYPRMSHLQKLSEVFGVPMSALVDDTDTLKDAITDSLGGMKKEDLRAVLDFIKGQK